MLLWQCLDFPANTSKFDWNILNAFIENSSPFYGRRRSCRWRTRSSLYVCTYVLSCNVRYSVSDVCSSSEEDDGICRYEFYKVDRRKPDVRMFVCSLQNSPAPVWWKSVFKYKKVKTVALKTDAAGTLDDTCSIFLNKHCGSNGISILRVSISNWFLCTNCTLLGLVDVRWVKRTDSLVNTSKHILLCIQGNLCKLRIVIDIQFIRNKSFYF